MESKDLLDLCRQHGLDVKNQLSNLEPEQVQAIHDLVRKGGGVAVAAAPAPKTPQRTANLDSKVRTLHAPKTARPTLDTASAEPPAPETPAAVEAPAAATLPPSAPAVPPIAAPAKPAAAPTPVEPPPIAAAAQGTPPVEP